MEAVTIFGTVGGKADLKDPVIFAIAALSFFIAAYGTRLWVQQVTDEQIKEWGRRLRL
jgi:hypothetical protein